MGNHFPGVPGRDRGGAGPGGERGGARRRAPPALMSRHARSPGPQAPPVTLASGSRRHGGKTRSRPPQPVTFVRVVCCWAVFAVLGSRGGGRGLWVFFGASVLQARGPRALAIDRSQGNSSSLVLRATYPDGDKSEGSRKDLWKKTLLRK